MSNSNYTSLSTSIKCTCFSLRTYLIYSIWMWRNSISYFLSLSWLFLWFISNYRLLIYWCCSSIWRSKFVFSTCSAFMSTSIFFSTVFLLSFMGDTLIVLCLLVLSWALSLRIDSSVSDVFPSFSICTFFSLISYYYTWSSKAYLSFCFSASLNMLWRLVISSMN